MKAGISGAGRPKRPRTSATSGDSEYQARNHRASATSSESLGRESQNSFRLSLRGGASASRRPARTLDRNLSAFEMTDAELKLIARAAIIGDSSQPVIG